MSKEKGLKIIKLTTENVKKLKAVEIIPKDNTVVISGANENGKTSVLDAIFLALGGQVASKGITKPIRDGQESAFSRVDLGDIIVTRKWTKSGTNLTVENRDGAVFKSPQAILDELIGSLSFDPLAFSNMKDSDQRETLLDLVDIDLDLDAWEITRKKYYDDRTEVNRSVKQLQGQIAGIEVPEGTPDEEVKTSTILEEIEAAQKTQNANDETRRTVDSLRSTLEALNLQKETLEEKLRTTLDHIKDVKSDLMELNPVVAKLIDPDMEIFKGKLETVEQTNEHVREKSAKQSLQLDLEVEEKESQRLTEEINEMDVSKATAIESAAFPIEHLGFDETGVTYKGIPFGQCSAAESLRVSLSIAIAINPKLRVLRITDGSLLDSKNMKIIKDMVKEHDFQCWCEVVKDSPDGASVYIEDGEIKESSDE